MAATRGALVLVLTGTLAWSACGPAKAPPPPPSPSPFRPVADVRQLMTAVLEPAAEVYWDAVGTIIDRNGVVERAPKNDEEWEAVRHGAYVIAESGNLLMMDGRARDSGEWIIFSQALVDVGRKAIRAAEAKDKAAVFDVGAEVYDACTACHAKYAVQTLRPNTASP
jgi:hypothetical protein